MDSVSHKQQGTSGRHHPLYRAADWQWIEIFEICTSVKMPWGYYGTSHAWDRQTDGHTATNAYCSPT